MPSRRDLTRVFGRTGLVQIDSVNVLVRAHYMPLFSRIGPYEPALLEDAAYGPRSRRALFEYWGHEASLLPVALYPLMRWRMRRAEKGEGIYNRLATLARERTRFVQELLRTIERDGALAASDFEGGAGKGSWWGWSDAKLALEFLFWAGRLTTAYRRGFERVYDLPERVLPAKALAGPVPSEADAQRELVRIAARALGVATESDLRDYFRLDLSDARQRVRELVESGELVPHQVEGWRAQAFAPAGLSIPRSVPPEKAALISPFDSLVWERKRTERVFGFRYRIEIYTPAHKRVHGYYVLPFLLGDRLPARVDLKAERASGTLLVLSRHLEKDVDAAEVDRALGSQLDEMAKWLRLPAIVRADRSAKRLRA